MLVNFIVNRHQFYFNMMAVSASFERNVFLLSQVIAPSDEFKKYFRKNMFSKPNTTGFLHISHYLLTIYDSNRFKTLCEWPVICKKTEAQYRNNVKNFLQVISMENPDIGFPNILASHLIHAGGNKFTIIMWKLSQVALRKYLINSQTTHNIISVPQIGVEGSLGKKFLQKANKKLAANILNKQKNLSEIMMKAKTLLEDERKILSTITTKIFEKKQLLTTLSCVAPVHPLIKEHIIDLNNEEAIEMWTIHINDGLHYLKNKNIILKNIKELSSKVNDLIPNRSSDAKISDVNQFEKINYLEISESFSDEIQCILYQLYKDDKLVFRNFILLFNLLLTQLWRQLKSNPPESFSDCLLQIEASCEDMTKASNVFETYLSDVAKMLSEKKDILREKNAVKTYNDTVLPAGASMLLMSSPVIKINTDCSDEESDLLKRLQFTPVEGMHKSLFSRYERLKKNDVSHESTLKVKQNLAPRIDFDDTMLSTNNEGPSLHTFSMPYKKNLPTFKNSEKYSRLFSTCTKRNNKAANSSIMSIPCSSKANSTTISSAIEEIHDLSELSVNSLCDVSIKFTTPKKLINEQEDKHENASEMEDVINALPNDLNMLHICETIETEIKYDGNNDTVETESKKHSRHSISDLVERYKKILERSNRTPSPKISYTNCKSNV
ncbi:LOW QUALITY PROTEIN: uncharacterized protein LOC143347097 [Colletes latitarsis]|uniref:LOW QUALITY PROTEIN: uncharacterized protein LOC143347097 n=1 Tax=Colletes latitarsis TaxID=2605962 RepID=UPI004036FE09